MMVQVQYPAMRRLAHLLLALAFVLTGIQATPARPAAPRKAPGVSVIVQAPGSIRLAQRSGTQGQRGRGNDGYPGGGSSGGGVSIGIDVMGLIGGLNNSNPPPVKKTPPRRKKKTYRRTPRKNPPRVVQPIPQFFANEVTVLIGQNQPQSVDSAVAQAYGLTILSVFPIALLDGRLVRFRIPAGRTVAQLIATLLTDPRIDAAQPNNLYMTVVKKSKRTARGPVQYSLAKLGLARAHKLSQGQGVTVAVIDTGMDASHPVLAKAVSQSFNAVGDARHKAQNHGTAIAGLIAGQGKVTGAAPRANLLAVRAFYMHPVYRRPVTSSAILLRALDWAFANKAQVINMSFTGPFDPLMKKALERAAANGVILVGAAGNGGAKAPPAYPAAYNSVIAITALDHKDRLYAHANRGSYVSLAAPGVDMLVPSLKKGYRYSSGTSLAAAQISGLIALLLERHPQASAQAVRDAIVSSAHDLGPKGYDVQFGAGRADAHASLISLATSGQ